MKKLLPLLLCVMLPLAASEKDKDKPKPTPSDVMKLTGMGSDAGAKAGMGAVLLIGQGLSSFGATVKGYAIATAAYVKGTAVAVASAPATPYVAGGAAVGAAGYAGYKTYRHFVPLPEERERRAEHERKAQIAEEQTEITKCRRARSRSVASFTSCLSKHRRSTTFTQQGYPTQCEDEAFELSMHEEGDTEVDKLVKKFAKYAPQKREDGK